MVILEIEDLNSSNGGLQGKLSSSYLLLLSSQKKKKGEKKKKIRRRRRFPLQLGVVLVFTIYWKPSDRNQTESWESSLARFTGFKVGSVFTIYLSICVCLCHRYRSNGQTQEAEILTQGTYGDYLDRFFFILKKKLFLSLLWEKNCQKLAFLAEFCPKNFFLPEIKKNNFCPKSYKTGASRYTTSRCAKTRCVKFRQGPFNQQPVR